jgi:hypothetical protein
VTCNCSASGKRDLVEAFMAQKKQSCCMGHVKNKKDGQKEVIVGWWFEWHKPQELIWGYSRRGQQTGQSWAEIE